MKALLCKAWGPPESLVVEDVPDPVPGAGEVVVRVRAAAANFPDVLIVQGRYQVKPPLPFSPGIEFAGEVLECGAGVTGPEPGARVMGYVDYGAFATRVRVPAAHLVPTPAGMDDVTASAFLITYGTAQHALVHRGRLAAGETLVVLGAAGGVGLAAIDIGKALGARVIACASSADKLDVCRARGADECVNYADEDLRERLKVLGGKAGIDVVYDAVGGHWAEPAFRSLGWRGRYLVIGFAAGDIPKLPLNLALLLERDIVGVYWGAWTRHCPDEFAQATAELARWFADGRLRPHVSATYPLERAAQALADLASRRAKGKIVVVMPPS